MEDKEILAKLDQLKREAWDARDFDMVNFYIDTERRMRELIVVGKALGSLYNNTQDDDAWNAMHEALSDAGLA